MPESWELEPEVAAHALRVIERCAAIRVPALLAEKHPDALYWSGNRHGITTVALRTTSIPVEQLRAIMTYRLGQYLALDYVNKRMVYEAGLEHESLDSVAASDVHVIVGDATSSEILCYMMIKAGPESPPGTTLRTRDRPLFPVEQIFGWGVFNRLRILPDLPLDRLGELERFVKNQLREAIDELGARAPAETVLAVFRLLAGPLGREIEACMIDIEEGVKAKKVLDFLHVPSVVIHGVVPYVGPDAYPLPSYQRQTRYPCAFLCSDIPTVRLDEIERALAQPGRHGVAALLGLKADVEIKRSSLEPSEGLTPLSEVAIRQEGVRMETRRLLREVGDWLRGTRPFRDLSAAEASVLSTFLERGDADVGTPIVRQGEDDDDLYLIESGTAEVQVTTRRGHRLVVKHLGPGDYFGEIALLAGGERTADVVSTTPLTFLRLSRDAYARYLAQMSDVEGDLTRTALAHSRDTLRTVKESES